MYKFSAIPLLPIQVRQPRVLFEDMLQRLGELRPVQFGDPEQEWHFWMFWGAEESWEDILECHIRVFGLRKV